LEGRRVVIWGFDGMLRDSTLKTRQGNLPGFLFASLLGARHFVALMGCVIHEDAPRSGALPAKTKSSIR
jgi:hypothetical protein